MGFRLGNSFPKGIKIILVIEEFELTKFKLSTVDNEFHKLRIIIIGFSGLHLRKLALLCCEQVLQVNHSFS